MIAAPDIVNLTHVDAAIAGQRRRATIWAVGKSTFWGGLGLGALAFGALFGASFLLQPKIIKVPELIEVPTVYRQPSRGTTFSFEAASISAVLNLGIERRHERGRWKDNRAENSHRPTRRREREAAVQESGFSPEIYFHTRRRLQYLQRPTPSHSAQTRRVLRAAAMSAWRTAVAAA